MRILYHLIAACALIPLAAPVQAFSCADTSFIRDFHDRKRSLDTYELVSGRFTDVSHKTGEGHIWTATFVGFKASSIGFNKPFTTPVTIEGSGDFYTNNSDEPHDPEGRARGFENGSGLIFLRKSADGYHADRGLCNPMFYDARREKNQALACLRGSKDCPEPD